MFHDDFRYRPNPYIIAFILFCGLILLWFIVFRESFKQEALEIESAAMSLFDKAKIIPVAQQNQGMNQGVSPGINQAKPNPNQVQGNYFQPDAITSATPRTIAWLNNVVDQLKPSVVGIYVGDGLSPPPWRQNWNGGMPAGNTSVGSGVLVSPDGYVITNNHVVNAPGTITVSVFLNGNYTDFTAVLVENLKNTDIAVLKINSNNTFPFAQMGDSNAVEVGDRVIAIGNPYGLTQTVTSGIISAKRKSLSMGNQTLNNLFQTDVAINPGNSGGALCNMRSELIGINVAIYSPIESVYTGISFAIPINQVKTVLSKYVRNPVIANYQPSADNTDNNFRYVATNPADPAANVPVNPADTSPGAPVVNAAAKPPVDPLAGKIQPAPGEGIEELAWLGIDLVPDAEGVEVDEIEGISPMEAGLEAGDIIKAVNGMPTPDIYAYKEVIKKVPLNVGQTVMLDVYRPRNDKTLFIGFKLKKFDLKGR